MAVFSLPKSIPRYSFFIFDFNSLLSFVSKVNFFLILDVKQLQNDIGRLNKWLHYRNEITHGLFNKDLEDLRAKMGNLNNLNNNNNINFNNNNNNFGNEGENQN